MMCPVDLGGMIDDSIKSAFTYLGKFSLAFARDFLLEMMACCDTGNSFTVGIISIFIAPCFKIVDAITPSSVKLKQNFRALVLAGMTELDYASNITSGWKAVCDSQSASGVLKRTDASYLSVIKSVANMPFVDS